MSKAKALGCGSELVMENLTIAHFEVAYIDDPPSPGPTFRSCWVCNPAHERLKSCKWLVCFVCGKSYHEGVEDLAK